MSSITWPCFTNNVSSPKLKATMSTTPNITVIITVLSYSQVSTFSPLIFTHFTHMILKQVKVIGKMVKVTVSDMYSNCCHHQIQKRHNLDPCNPMNILKHRSNIEFKNEKKVHRIKSFYFFQKIIVFYKTYGIYHLFFFHYKSQTFWLDSKNPDIDNWSNFLHNFYSIS